MFSVLFSSYIGVELLAHKVTYVQFFEEVSNFFTVAAPFYIIRPLLPPQQCTRVLPFSSTTFLSLATPLLYLPGQKLSVPSTSHSSSKNLTYTTGFMCHLSG